MRLMLRMLLCDLRSGDRAGLAGQPYHLALASGRRGTCRGRVSPLGAVAARPRQCIEGLDDARPEIRNLVERAQRFLSLAALLTVVLAAVVVGLVARHYMRTHLDACAVMRCLGASGRQILLIHGGEFLLPGQAATRQARFGRVTEGLRSI